MNYSELCTAANQLRREVLEMVYNAGSGHIGGSLSAAEIMSALYFYELRLDPQNPRWAGRDRFVLSKGHATPIYYAALAQRGFFPREELTRFRSFGAMLQGHPDCKHIPGVDMSTGSLGQGVSAAVGMAISAKLRGEKHRAYTLLGDGELQEGQVWEAFMLAAHRKLDNLCVMIDNNGVQSDGRIDEVNSPNPIDRKLESFNFHVISTDGHDIAALVSALVEARMEAGKPTAIVAHTVKGRGVSFMEGRAEWHGRIPNAQEYARAMAELKEGEA